MSVKQQLIEKLRKDWKKYWHVKLFDELNFKRQNCSNCGKYFWAIIERNNCGDSSCTDYSFIGNPPTKKKFDLKQAWSAIEKFFEKNGHTSVKRYPTIARWRPDLYFNIASITSFQRIENNKIIFDFPSNPLIIPQPCLRFNDIPNVGVTGRHNTCFTMIGQHAIANKDGYWKDKAIELDWRLLTEVFGIDPKEITFTEDVWVGYGAFGYSLEYFVRGLELGNCVFTEFEGDLNNYKEMEEKVIDMGAGLERFAWISNGTPMSYDVAFGDVVPKMLKKSNINYDKEFFLRYSKIASKINADEGDMTHIRQDIANNLGVSVEEVKKKIEPMEAIYAIADHSRSLLYAICDGMIPSNTGGGYNLRTIARRMFYFMDVLKPKFSIEDVLKWHAEYLKDYDSSLYEHLEDVTKVLKHERRKYEESNEKIGRLVKSIIDSKQIITEEKMIELYDSQGVSPEILQQEALKQGMRIEIPGDFYVKVTARHVSEKIQYEKPKFDVDGVKKTELMFYEDAFVKEFEAKIIKVYDNKNVVLDKTYFYPRGGGQEPDSGTVGNTKISDIIKIGDVVIHITNGNFKEGDTVKCKIDWERRWNIMQHHTGIHILGAAAKKVLGKHIWQAGSFKDKDYARIDLTHFESLTDEQINEIENEVNKLIEKELDVKINWVDRRKAEEKYGFTIYQGGAIPGNKLRIIDISGKDIQACGGTHVKNTKDIGRVSITSSERIQDGVVRLTIVAGEAGKRHIEKIKEIVTLSSKTLDVDTTKLPKAAQKLFEEWKESNKKIEKAVEAFSEKKSNELLKKIENGIIISEIKDADPAMLIKVAEKLKEETRSIVLLGLTDKINIVMISQDQNSGKIVSDLCKKFGGGGGGSPAQASGVIKDLSKLNLTIKEIKVMIK